jgi:hypothetical protein
MIGCGRMLSLNRTPLKACPLSSGHSVGTCHRWPHTPFGLRNGNRTDSLVPRLPQCCPCCNEVWFRFRYVLHPFAAKYSHWMWH